MNFRQKRLAVLRSELKEVGLEWSEAKQLDKYDNRILYVVGKLLINYPISFTLEFIRESLQMPLGTKRRRHYLITAYSTYWQEIEKKKRA